MASLTPFQSTVTFHEGGKEHVAIVLADKGYGVLDIAFIQQLFAADGKTALNVVGSSRQAEMVQFRHDVKPDQYELVEDWFFGLADEHLEALLKERSRRKEEKLQAEFAAAAQAREQATLAGVIIRPSAQLLDTARKLWLESLKEIQQVDEHSEIVLPDYGRDPESWKPWIEKAKQALANQAPAQTAVAVEKNPGSGGERIN